MANPKKDDIWEIKPGRVILLKHKKEFYLRRQQQRNAPANSTAQSAVAEGAKVKTVETVFKVINWSKGQYSAKNQALYIGRGRDKDSHTLTLHNELGEAIKKREGIRQEIESWGLIPDQDNRSKVWENSSPDDREAIPYDKSLNKRQTVHMIFSLPDQDMILRGSGYNTTADELVSARIAKFSAAVKAAAQETFAAAGHRYVMAIHSESPYGDKLHAHILVKVENDKTKKQLRLNREDLTVLRNVFTEKSREQHFNVYASQRLDRPELEKQIKEGKAPLRNNKTAQQLQSKTKQGQVFIGKAPNWYTKYGESYEKRRLGIGDEKAEINSSNTTNLKTVIYRDPEKPLSNIEKAAVERLDRFFQGHFKNPGQAKESFLALYAESSKLAIWTANSHPIALGETTSKEIIEPLMGRGISRVVPPKPTNPILEVSQDIKNLQEKISAKNQQSLKMKEKAIILRETTILQQKVNQLKIEKPHVNKQTIER